MDSPAPPKSTKAPSSPTTLSTESGRGMGFRIGSKALFAVTIFLGSALLFQVQPLMSKLILPWFGGSPGVWTVCLLFFQSLLFAGYLYVHGLARWGHSRGGFLVHVLLIGAALFNPLIPSAAWKPTAETDPTLGILILLTCHVGLSYFLLSTTGPLIQVWFARAHPGESPYPLYALSNVGSLLGLISYPFLMDVWWSAPQQAFYWRAAFVLYGLLCFGCGWRAMSARSVAVAQPLTRINAPHVQHPQKNPWGVKALWFGLAMIPSVLLAAVTNKLSTDISPIPFLWVLPLTLYLITLILCFTRESLAPRRVWGPVLIVVLILTGLALGFRPKIHFGAALSLEFGLHLAALFTVCLVCHGELVRLKPLSAESPVMENSVMENSVVEHGATEAGAREDQALTEFYLIMSAGGAAGGLLTAVIAPLIFPLYAELHLGYLAGAVVPMLAWQRDTQGQWWSERPVWKKLLLAAGLLAMVVGLAADIVGTVMRAKKITRNFYGVLRIIEHPSYNELAHGSTEHGLQPRDPAYSRLPTTYFGLTSGVGIALASHHPERHRRVGIVGLGVGTLATYGRKGDVYDFYEIDPAVREIAETSFRYLKETRAEVHVIAGDARLSLERREPQQYDLLILDAFSSDAIPIHLLTAEAMDIYRKHLAPDGILAAHVSSQYFHLPPVLSGHAQRLGWATACIVNREVDRELFTLPSTWVLLSPHPDSLTAGALALATKTPIKKSLTWTDQRHSLFEVLGK